MKKKKLPEYEIIESIRQITNPEIELIQKARIDLKNTFYKKYDNKHGKGDTHNGNNRPNF